MVTYINKPAKDKPVKGVISMDFAYLRKLVREHSAVVLDKDKEYLAELHLGSLAESAGFDSIASLVAHLKTEPFGGLHIQVIEALVTNETSFFRDRHPFEALKKSVLPELVNKRVGERSLNIWCAACSSGQEPYSIAMLIREEFPILANWKLRLIASDFSVKVLTRARKGRYNQLEINRGLSQELRDKYFQQQGDEWEINEEIRQMVEFHQINLIQSWSFLPRMDVIFLRNVLIYFDIETRKTILGKVQELLRPDGCLFLGGSETTINLNDSFERVKLENSICHRLLNISPL
ncbi:protein-glutamate O-methyltransferase CheR [Aetokthonos hydrillicola Thurmond2011]|jgi:chemotaxis protein methyltransferase CheR|uniref:Protein-glutamate O-methyltransferase CheR n=1 Tax=Aetokthonos hydrillicola Thurmond2011 TaxID=2712845 RepID=A0AAP5I4G2_9CYAN|nr:protein-glutamate O-methyltransferase CheR [Aetokthonos hydrillicola]MBO3459348.1 protein-glutamate O-methyltransferase CheR [Aetokthonos hydrillicola CCALA 1050]MBW4586494.1 protein-glutamate O-methyltransferase CheR [Aetokthonos hydrillicola CCALA 1050]MDR9893562.1 protein-glutamate O-methyltransferase CheR [Aetokthonos hydrillicola Thurmond2011]